MELDNEEGFPTSAPHRVCCYSVQRIRILAGPIDVRVLSSLNFKKAGIKCISQDSSLSFNM